MFARMKSYAIRFLSVGLCVASTQLLSSEVNAQNPPPSLELQWFRPAMGGGMLETNVGEVTGHLTGTASVWTSYSRRPLRTELSQDGVPLGDVVSERVDVWASAGLGLFDVAELRVLVPFVAYQDGLNTDIVRLAAGSESLTSSTLGDVSADLRVALLEQGDASPAVAVRFAAYLPTGDPEQLAGNPDGAYEGTLIVSKTLGLHVLALEAGYVYRPEAMRLINLEIGDEILYRLGYRVRLGRTARPRPLSVLMEVAGRTTADRAFGTGGGSIESDVSMEGRLGLRYRWSGPLGLIDLDIAGGFALANGYGSSQPRVLLGGSYATSDPVADDDGDGLVNAYDECPDEAEDIDDFQDEDGCPDLDNDNDEIPDEDDECPNEPEDLDDTDDLDGCPDEEIPDTDDDGYGDDVDKCVNEAEDFDRFEDEDGCPEPDNDGDGLADLNDLCPNEPEDKDGVEDDDGCPDDEKPRQLVQMRRGRIEFMRPVRFEPDGDTLAKGSLQILEQAAELLKRRAKPKITVQVFPERPNRNSRLVAKTRAERLTKELVLLGVEESRITAQVGRWKRKRRGEVTVLFGRGK